MQEFGCSPEKIIRTLRRPDEHFKISLTLKVIVKVSPGGDLHITVDLRAMFGELRKRQI